jgi:hypothetical protein
MCMYYLIPRTPFTLLRWCSLPWRVSSFISSWGDREILALSRFRSLNLYYVSHGFLWLCCVIVDHTIFSLWDVGGNHCYMWFGVRWRKWQNMPLTITMYQQGSMEIQNQIFITMGRPSITTEFHNASNWSEHVNQTFKCFSMKTPTSVSGVWSHCSWFSLVRVVSISQPTIESFFKK